VCTESGFAMLIHYVRIERAAEEERPAGNTLAETIWSRRFRLRRIERPVPGEAVVRLDDWRSGGFDFWKFDRMVDSAAAAERFRLSVSGSSENELVKACAEIAIRAQRANPIRNQESRRAEFAVSFEAHHRLHDLTRPLVRADYDHSVDAWQWLLHLDPSAELAPQLAVLFHDVERLWSESEQRREHRAADYDAFKRRHAAEGAAFVDRLLETLRLDISLRQKVASLISCHETGASDPLISLLRDADALSFFSLNCSGYLRYYGESQTRKKVDYTLERMSARAMEQLALIRLPPLVAALVAERHPSLMNTGNRSETLDVRSATETEPRRDRSHGPLSG
jgi:hypothetical protein